MMLLKKIVIENFGPYFGQHTIELDGDSDELVLVYGENMAGKTSLLNAVRWCLYGTAKDRSGQAIPTVKLINTDAVRDGQNHVSVALSVVDRREDEEVPVHLKRKRQAKATVSEPTAEKDFDEHLDVEVDGRVQPAALFDDIVNSMLPESISRFFLFDGELLREYEELVHEDSTSHARQVKRAIEMILGVPAVQNGQADLAYLHGKASRAYNKEAKKHEDIEESARAADALQDQVSELEKNLAELEREQDGTLTNLRDVRAEIQKHRHLAASVGRLNEAERTLDRLKKEREDKLARRRELAKDLWRDILEPRLKHEVEKLERERDQIGSALSEKAKVSEAVSRLEAAIEDSQCPHCGQELPEHIRLRTREELDEARARLSELSQVADQSRHDQLGATIRRMRDIAPAGVVSGLEALEQDLADIEVSQQRAERDRDAAREDLQGADPERMRTYEEREAELQKHLGAVEKEIEQCQEALAEKRAELREHQRAMKEKDEPTLQDLRLKRDLLDDARAVYDASVSDLIEELRQDVEREASAIFKDLTTDKSYSGLRINENYGLLILDRDGREVPVRSAGAEQVVALSFIGALNRLAARRGPVIMDTPFGRLDRSHRENILRFIPKLADQVALLVHSGEIDPERDLGPVEGHVSAAYQIRHESSARSRIEAVSHG